MINSLCDPQNHFYYGQESAQFNQTCSKSALNFPNQIVLQETVPEQRCKERTNGRKLGVCLGSKVTNYMTA